MPPTRQKFARTYAEGFHDDDDDDYEYDQSTWQQAAEQWTATQLERKKVALKTENYDIFDNKDVSEGASCALTADFDADWTDPIGEKADTPMETPHDVKQKMRGRQQVTFFDAEANNPNGEKLDTPKETPNDVIQKMRGRQVFNLFDAEANNPNCEKLDTPKETPNDVIQKMRGRQVFNLFDAELNTPNGEKEDTPVDVIQQMRGRQAFNLFDAEAAWLGMKEDATGFESEFNDKALGNRKRRGRKQTHKHKFRS